jgi:2'-5' RNA ligase superfamily
MSSLTAIDILILPDPAMQTKATAWNTRLRQSVPDGFALDENHTPHITLLQRYVRTDQLDDVYNVVASTIATAPVETLELTAVKLAHMQVAATPGVGLAGLLVKASPAVIDLQTALIVAIKPHTGSGGTAEAYVTSDAEPDINDDTLRYVDNYVPDHSGENYLAHVTVGQAKLDDLATLEAETFDPFTFRPAGFAVYHLGNNGTAQVQLHKWDLG